MDKRSRNIVYQFTQESLPLRVVLGPASWAEGVEMPGFRRWRGIVLLGAPLALGLLEVFHPHYADDAARELLPHADRWLLVHLLQLPLFGLLAFALYLLVEGLAGPAATASRVGTAIFVVFYTALDAVAGIATGVLARHALGAPEAEREALTAVIDQLFTHPLVGGGFSLVTAIATAGWLLATLGAAAAHARAGSGLPPVLLLAVAGLVFAVGHVPPSAQIGLGALFAAAAWLEFSPGRRP